MVAIDQTNALNWYVSTAAGVSLRWCGSGSGCGAAEFAGAPTIGYAQVDEDASLIDEPVLLDPADASDVLIGTCRVWRGAAESGAGWPGGNAISAMLGGPLGAKCNGTTNPSVRSLAAGGPASGAVAAANAGSTVLYAGMAGKLDGGGTYGGHLFAEYAAGTASGDGVDGCGEVGGDERCVGCGGVQSGRVRYLGGDGGCARCDGNDGVCDGDGVCGERE
jgi:hypothetical protein